MKSLIATLYESGKTVFTTRDVGLLLQNDNTTEISRQLTSSLARGELTRLRKGMYALPNYDVREAANKIQVPSYISMETVLRANGIIFQYDLTITLASYQPRIITLNDGTQIEYRKLATPILISPKGIVFGKNYTTATLERAFLDLCYIDKWRTYDNTAPIDRQKVLDLLPIYDNKALTQRASKILSL